MLIVPILKNHEWQNPKGSNSSEILGSNLTEKTITEYCVPSYYGLTFVRQRGDTVPQYEHILSGP